MSILFGDLFPTGGNLPPRQYDPPTGGSTSPGAQSLKFEVNGIEADVGRVADQTQDVFQGARAFFGSQATNTLEQQENAVQEATGLNEKFITYHPPAPNSEAFLSELNTAAFASRHLARGRADSFQDQIAGQSAVSSGWDDTGIASEALNELIQSEVVDQVIDSAKVRTVFDLRHAGDVWNAASTRRIDGIFDEHNAESNLLNRQRQGYTTNDPENAGNTLHDNPSTQFAAADGTLSVNNMVQEAISTQKSNASIENILDMRRDPAEVFDSGVTDIAISLNGDFVDGTNPGGNRALSFVESIQEQALVQQAEAGLDEHGNSSFMGGTAMNNAIQTADNVQIADTYHLTDILI